MKIAKKALALFLSMLLAFSVATVAFAEEAAAPEVSDETTEETLNPFSLFGGFFEKIGELMRIVFEFLENMFTGNGNNALEELK